MTAPALPMLLAPVVITADSNDDIRIEGDSAQTATITAGTYYLSGLADSGDLYTAIQTALNDSADAGTWTVTTTANGLTYRKPTISCNTTNSSAWSIDWDYTAGGFHGLDATILGVTDTSAAFGASDGQYYPATTQPKYSWYPSTAPATNDGHAGAVEATESDVIQTRANSGAVWTVRTGGPFEVRLVTFEGEPQYKLIPDGSYPNESLKAFIEAYAYAGQRLRYYPDRTTAGYFDCVLDEETLRAFHPRRLAPGVALYGTDLGMRGYVA